MKKLLIITGILLSSYLSYAQRTITAQGKVHQLTVKDSLDLVKTGNKQITQALQQHIPIKNNFVADNCLFYLELQRKKELLLTKN